MAYGYARYDDYLKNNGIATRILSISDSHVPFQLPINIFKDYVGKVDILQLNGDIVDMQQISRFPKSYRVSVMEEIIKGRQYIIDLIEYIKPKKVIANYGNHELRFQKYLSKNLDSDLLELMPETVLDLIFIDGFKHYDKRTKTKVEYEPLQKVFKDIEIEYTGRWFCQIGETIFCHPNAFSSGMMKTSERALQWFRNEGYRFTSLVMAHTHRLGEYTIGNTTMYEQGATCDTKQQYYSDGNLTNSQKEGFIYLCQDEHGKIIKDRTKLVVLN
jgi:predicted phosphodiesterase